MCVNLAMLVCKVVSGVKKNVDYPEKHEVFVVVDLSYLKVCSSHDLVS